MDTGRFPEFTEEVKSRDVRRSRLDLRVHGPAGPPGEGNPRTRTTRSSTSRWRNSTGSKRTCTSTDKVVIVEGANAFNRGGALRLGSVLTTTSAPLRTSPVKRGDWVLRRILGTPTPPPPADAGTIPADDQTFGGHDAPAAARAAQAQRDLRDLPYADRSDGLSARRLRCGRPDAHEVPGRRAGGRHRRARGQDDHRRRRRPAASTFRARTSRS